MKKLMFAAAVTAGLVAIGDGIESQNTVGYLSCESGMGIENIGAAVAPINASGEWTCSAAIYDTAAVEGDVVMFLNPEIFDLLRGEQNGNTSGEQNGTPSKPTDPCKHWL